MGKLRAIMASEAAGKGRASARRSRHEGSIHTAAPSASSTPLQIQPSIAPPFRQHGHAPKRLPQNVGLLAANSTVFLAEIFSLAHTAKGASGAPWFIAVRPQLRRVLYWPMGRRRTGRRPEDRGPRGCG